jgi:hypothetical protein
MDDLLHDFLLAIGMKKLSLDNDSHIEQEWGQTRNRHNCQDHAAMISSPKYLNFIGRDCKEEIHNEIREIATSEIQESSVEILEWGEPIELDYVFTRLRVWTCRRVIVQICWG